MESTPPLLANLSDSELLAYGVPSEWLPDVRKANDETLSGPADHLPKGGSGGANGVLRSTGATSSSCTASLPLAIVAGTHAELAPCFDRII